jgi:hypothetical protein
MTALLRNPNLRLNISHQMRGNTSASTTYLPEGGRRNKEKKQREENKEKKKQRTKTKRIKQNQENKTKKGLH